MYSRVDHGRMSPLLPFYYFFLLFCSRSSGLAVRSCHEFCARAWSSSGEEKKKHRHVTHVPSGKLSLECWHVSSAYLLQHLPVEVWYPDSHNHRLFSRPRWFSLEFLCTFSVNECVTFHLLFSCSRLWYVARAGRAWSHRCSEITTTRTTLWWPGSGRCCSIEQSPCSDSRYKFKLYHQKMTEL